MDKIAYSPWFRKTINSSHVNTKKYVAVVLKGSASSAWPPSIIHETLKMTHYTIDDAMAAAQRFMDRHGLENWVEPTT